MDRDCSKSTTLQYFQGGKVFNIHIVDNCHAEVILMRMNNIFFIEKIKSQLLPKPFYVEF